MDTSPIIIAGGGIAGLASALALGPHNGLVLEKAMEFKPTGAGIQLGPNAVRALQKLGVWDLLEPQASKPTEIQFRDGLTGKLLTRFELGAAFATRFGEHYHVIHRANLHAALLEIARSKPNLEVELGQPLLHIELATSGVQVRIKAQNRRTPALIVTDGIQSQLRQVLIPGSVALKTGATFHRALLPVSVLEDSLQHCVVVWMLPGGHVVHYALGNTQQVNVVAISPENKTPEVFFEQVTPVLADLLSHAIPKFTVWPALYVPPLNRWSFGHALFLGDAAHGTLPYMAQGAAMALEDAACLSQVLRTTHNLRDAFAETANRRIPRTRRVHFETLKTGKIYHAHSIGRHLRNHALAVVPDSVMKRRVEWLYAHEAT